MSADPATSEPPAAAPEWEPPTSDQEWKVTKIDEAPAWVDKGWASWSQGPAVAVPTSGLLSEGPYTTAIARSGDTIKFIAGTPSKEAHFEIIQGEPTGDQATKKPIAATNASLEDMLKSGLMSPDDLSDEAKGQVVSRSPKLKGLIEEGKGAPEAIPVTDTVKTS
jgi:hypothetical protein